jgi:hypothetical protein
MNIKQKIFIGLLLLIFNIITILILNPSDLSKNVDHNILLNFTKFIIVFATEMIDFLIGCFSIFWIYDKLK